MHNEDILGKKQQSLIRKRKFSCMSKGEQSIAEFLSYNRIDFHREFFFKEMKRNGKTKLLFFDFYIPSYKIAIEFDGEQHYTGVFKGKKLFNQRENDFIKNAFCAKNDIKILRIKYDAEDIERIICEFFDKWI